MKLTVEAAQSGKERDDSSEAAEDERSVSAEARALALTRADIARWKQVRWARGVVVFLALSCFVALTREPFTLILMSGLFGVAYWVSRRAPLPGLLIAFATALPGWTYTIVAAVLDWGYVYYAADLAEDELPRARADVSLWKIFFIVVFATLLWRGLAAAARLTGEVKRSWYLLRPALILSVAMAILSSIALNATFLSGFGALVLECIMIAGAAPVVWRARHEWGTLGDLRRLAPRHALETVGVLVALVAFMQGYLHLAGVFGVETLDSVQAYLLEEWPEEAILLLLVGWAPLVEELLFRGFVQSRLERVTTPGNALVAQAMLFSAVHAVPGSLASHAVIGLALGFLRNRTGTLYGPFVLHASYNAWFTLSDLGYLPESLMFG